jgi:ribonuclease G
MVNDSPSTAGGGYDSAMQAEILINITSQETRAAVLSNGVLQEIMVERAEQTGLLGNVYQGRVVRVLPGMQAAFVDIGLERTAFLHASDIQTHKEGLESSDIRRLLREGDSCLVQIIKEPLGSKGARLSTFISIPSRYLVLLPENSGVGISARIEDETERQRLKELVEAILPAENFGCIVRTAAEGMSADALQADLRFVNKLWASLVKRAASQSGIQKVYSDLPLEVRVVRDLAHHQVECIRVDSQNSLDRIRQFVADFMPGLDVSVELYKGGRPIFDLYAIDEEIDRSLKPNVALKSGGYLLIEQTEAMTTIDVNTGAYVGRSSQEETVFRTNLEAAGAIAHQLRLRNLGGIIILDFIDMESEAHRLQVLDALEAGLAGDTARNQICHISPLGLVEMTRRRTRESLQHILCEPCPTCQGKGQIKTPATVCYEIFREILRIHNQFPAGELVILAHDDVAEMLLDEESAGLAELENLTGRALRLQAQSTSAPDEFDVVPV